MARPYRELQEKMSPERQAQNQAQADRELLAMNLRELRQRCTGLTQVAVADLLGVTQAAISQLENRDDALLRNLAEYVKTLGGRLELIARFPDGEDVRISQFEAVKEQIEASHA